MSSSRSVRKHAQVPGHLAASAAAAVACRASPAPQVCETTCCRFGGSPARFVGSRHGVSGSEHSISLAVGVRVFCEKPP